MPRGLYFIVLALVLAGCSAGGSSDTGAGFVAGTGSVDFLAADRDPAPSVTAETLEGEQLSLEDMDGIVVVNFWASWCGPCATEAPDLVAIHDTYRDRGVHVVGVNVRDTTTNALSFERDFRVPYPSWFDPDAQIAARFGGIGPSALPTTILVDHEGRVASRLFGAVTARQLSPRLDALIEDADAEASRPTTTGGG